MRTANLPGIATHYRPTEVNVSSCGIPNPQYAAFDPRDIDCKLCKRTKAYRRAMGRSKKTKLNQGVLNAHS